MLLGAVFFWTLLVSAGALRNFHFKLTRVECQSTSPIILKDVNCSIDVRPNQRYLLNFNFTLRRVLPQARVHAQILVLRANRNSHVFIDTELDVCKFLTKGYPGNIFAIILKAVTASYSSEMPTCPLRQDYQYVAQDLFIDPEDFPPYVPEVPFEFRLDFFTNDTLIAHFNVQGEVIYKRNIWTSRKVGGRS